jgi:hypothetical protein
MARIEFDQLMHEVAFHAGMPDDRPAHLESAVRVIFSAIAAGLPSVDRDELARVFPIELDELDELDVLGEMTDHDVFARVARELHLPLGAAIELTEAVLQVVGASVDPSLRARLGQHLPRTLAAHLEGRPYSEPPPRFSRPRAEEPAPPRTTLSSGRPGSTHPVSESTPRTAHQHSVAENPEPHADTKLSGARGLTQERLHETLGEGAPPRPSRTVSG